MKRISICLVGEDRGYAEAFAKVVALDHAGYAVAARESCVDCPGGYDACLIAESLGFSDGVGVDSAGVACREACGGLVMLRDFAGKGFSDMGAGEDSTRSFSDGPRADSGKNTGRIANARASVISAFTDRHAGVASILDAARRVVLDRALAGPETGGGTSRRCEAGFAGAPDGEKTICLHALAGGVGTSCCAIGIGRELARYRAKRVLCLSLEDRESAALCLSGVSDAESGGKSDAGAGFATDSGAGRGTGFGTSSVGVGFGASSADAGRCSGMSAEEMLYRLMRCRKDGAGQETVARLLQESARPDEYGLFRLRGTAGLNSLAALGIRDMLDLVCAFGDALSTDFLILDFGTRLHALGEFVDVCEPIVVEVRPESPVEGTPPFSVDSLFADSASQSFVFANPVCPEDIRDSDGRVEVSLANAFGLAVKRVCDQLLGEETEDSLPGLAEGAPHGKNARQTSLQTQFALPGAAERRQK
jgi:hypothetical protein